MGRVLLLMLLVFGSLLAIPVLIGIGGAAIGVIAGIFGAVIGVVAAVFGALIAIPAAILGVIFEGVHFAGVTTGFTQIVLLVLLFFAVYMAFRKRKPAKQDR